MFAPVYIHRLARLLAFGAVICLIACTSVSAKVVYVNANAPGAAHNGATWATAFLTIQDGLNAAVSGDDVWVAAGLYPERIVLPQPRWPWTDTSPGVRVYGGFAGTGSTSDARDWNAHPSIIDGGGEGIVVTLPPWATNTGIDGFTVRNAAPGLP